MHQYCCIPFLGRLRISNIFCLFCLLRTTSLGLEPGYPLSLGTSVTNVPQWHMFWHILSVIILYAYKFLIRINVLQGQTCEFVSPRYLPQPTPTGQVGLTFAHIFTWYASHRIASHLISSHLTLYRDSHWLFELISFIRTNCFACGSQLPLYS